MFQNLRSTKYFLFLLFLNNFFVIFLNLSLIFLLNLFLKTFVINIFLIVLIWVKKRINNAISFNKSASNSSSMSDTIIDFFSRDKEIISSFVWIEKITVSSTINEEVSIFSTSNENIIVFIVFFSRNKEIIVFIVFFSWNKNNVFFSQDEETLKSWMNFCRQEKIMIADCSSKQNATKFEAKTLISSIIRSSSWSIEAIHWREEES